MKTATTRRRLPEKSPQRKQAIAASARAGSQLRTARARAGRR
jgi:hypothetical protein